MASCALLTVVASSALARAGHSSGPVSAVDTVTGRHLPANPDLRAGERVTVTARGFAAHVSVTVALVGVSTLDNVVADGHGIVGYVFTVPRTLDRGQHALALSGPPHGRSAQQPGGNVVVSVPLTEQWPFRTG